ncbi:unnamed protein product [Brassica rapa]|uniref:Uncharacterized protein n=2 Tax=Brassica TaxID=3705 RepID=A0A3P5YPV4_BRACM|nr:unnamed protein product [Brassica rapa]VDC65634.1 unnamed protein product [Brassica rapa]
MFLVRFTSGNPETNYSAARCLVLNLMNFERSSILRTFHANCPR